MKYVYVLIFFVSLSAGCSNANEDIHVTEVKVLPSQVVSLELVGNHQVEVNKKMIISISDLAKDLKEKNLKRHALASVIVHKDDAVSDLVDVQDALREANLHRINYSTAKL